jgi:hypothetical protein
MLQELTLARTQLLETLERIIQIGSGVEILVRDPSNLVELQRPYAASALCGETGASPVDKQISHDLGGERQEMRSVW